MTEVDKKLEQQELINFLRKDLNLIPEDFAGYYSKGWFFLDTNKFKKVLVEELHKTFHDVWKNENDLFILNFGREGSGKSLFSLWLAYEIFKKDGKELNVLDNVVFDHPEWVLRQIALNKNILIYDEAEDTFNTMNFQTHEGREGMKIAIRNRAQNIVNILNFPSLRYLHPYIREERMDLLFLNLNYVYYVGNERRRVFIKAVYDKDDAVRILSEMSKTTFIDKKRIFRYKRGGRSILKFKPKIAGIFLLEKEMEDPNFQKVLKFYKFKKSETMDFVKVETLINNVFKKERFYLLVKMIQEMPSFILLLFKMLYKFTFKYPLIKYNYNFEFKSKKEELLDNPTSLKEKEFYIFPERFFLTIFPKEIWYLITEKLVNLKFFEKIVFIDKLKNKLNAEITFKDRCVILRKENIFMLRSILNANYLNAVTLDKYVINRLISLGNVESKKDIYEKMIINDENKEFLINEYFKVERLLDNLFSPRDGKLNSITFNKFEELKKENKEFKVLIYYLSSIFNYNMSGEGYDVINEIDKNILKI